MNDFIKKIINDMKLGKDYSQQDIYYLLKYDGVKKSSENYQDIEKMYQDFLSSLNNSLVKYLAKSVGEEDNKTHYISFYALEKADFLEAVKVYFPVKYEYMISALKTVFLYLIRNSIKAVVKFHVKATNEGIVIRFYDNKDVLPFIQYCNNNFILTDLLLPCNPFIATIYGIGVVRDDNVVSTFNDTLAKLLFEYVQFVKDNESYDNACDLDFLDYVRKRANMEEDNIIKYNIKGVEASIEAILNRTNPI